VIDEALSSLEVEALDRVIDVLSNELAGTGVIHIGRAAEGRDALFTRELHLVKAPDSAARRAHAETWPWNDPAAGS
jgi:putative ATP-binding cassette transporter